MSKKNIYCFFGIDGVGKTTLTKALKKKLAVKKKPAKIIYFGRGKKNKIKLMNFAVKLNSFYWNRKKKKATKKKDNKFSVDMYRKRNFLFLLVYYIELWVRYFEARKLAKNNIVLLDRYFYDILILTHNKYTWFFKFFTPKIKGFFLYAPYEVISKRKKEATIEGIKKYFKETEKLRKYFEITKIDVSKPLDRIIKSVELEIKNE